MTRDRPAAARLARATAQGSSRPWSSVSLAAVLRAVALLLAVAGSSVADERPVPQGVSKFPATMASRAAPLRAALVIAADTSEPPRGTRLRYDVEAYRDRLQLLGFDATTVTAATRPDLEAGARAFVQSIQPASDVAVLMLGTIKPASDGLYLMPSEAVPAHLTPETLGAEGLRLADLLRRIAGHNVKAVVAIADFCREDTRGGTAGVATCLAGLAGLPEGTSVIAAEHHSAATDTADKPPSLRRDLLPAMAEEGQTFFQLEAALQVLLKASTLTLAGTPVLSRSFAFLPVGFFEGLPLPCNTVEPDLTPETLRSGASIEPLVAQCAEAAERYAFSPYFKAKLAIAQEQRAAQSALSGCSADSNAAYIDAYPGGRYRNAVIDQSRACTVAPLARPAPPENPLADRARKAVSDYFRGHDHQQGDSFGALVRLYPAQFRSHQAIVSRSDHLRRLGAWYGDYDSVQFAVTPDSLDFSGCTKDDACLVRGAATARTLKIGESQYAWRNGRFALCFDLTTTLVQSECGVSDPPGAPDVSCD